MADEIRFPNRNDLLKLPRWAQVVFAARCVRRVMRLTRRAWPEAPFSYEGAADETISLLEFVARVGHLNGRTDRGHDASIALVRATAAAAIAAEDAFEANAKAAAKVARAIGMAIRATHSIGGLTSHGAPATVAIAFSAAMDAGGSFGKARMVEAIAADYRVLLAESKRLNWTDRSPVDPDMLGSLWPDPPGEPDWAALMLRDSAASKPSTESIPQLAIEIAPGDATPKMIADYLESVSDLFHASGGVSLRFKRAGSKIYAVPEVPA